MARFRNRKALIIWCVSRTKPDVKQVNEQAKSVTVMDCDNHPITLTAIQTQTEDGDYWLKIKLNYEKFVVPKHIRQTNYLLV